MKALHQGVKHLMEGPCRPDIFANYASEIRAFLADL